MAYNTKPIITDVNGKPVPQYWNQTTDQFEPLQGANGANRVLLYDASGNPLTVTNGKLAVRASELEAILGEVAATPTANTLADRLKQIAERLGEVSANPTANTALARLKTLEGYLDGLEAALGTQADADATGNGSIIAILKRLRTILNDVWADAANALNVQLTGSIPQQKESIIDDATPVSVPAGSYITHVISSPNGLKYKQMEVGINSPDGAFANRISIDQYSANNRYLGGVSVLTSESRQSGSAIVNVVGSRLIINWFNGDSVSHNIYRYASGIRL